MTYSICEGSKEWVILRHDLRGVTLIASFDDEKTARVVCRDLNKATK